MNQFEFSDFNVAPLGAKELQHIQGGLLPAASCTVTCRSGHQLSVDHDQAKECSTSTTPPECGSVGITYTDLQGVSQTLECPPCGEA